MTRPNRSRELRHHVDVADDWCRATRSPMSSAKEIRVALEGVGVSDMTVSFRPKILENKEKTVIDTGHAKTHRFGRELKHWTRA